MEVIVSDSNLLYGIITTGNSGSAIERDRDPETERRMRLGGEEDDSPPSFDPSGPAARCADIAFDCGEGETVQRTPARDTRGMGY